MILCKLYHRQLLETIRAAPESHGQLPSAFSLQPSAFSLQPTAWQTSANLLRLELGAGGTNVFLVPSDSGASQRTFLRLGLMRATFLHRTGTMLGAEWSLGISAEERVLGLSSPHASRSAGFVVEGLAL